MELPPKGVEQLRKGRISIAGTAYFITKTAKQRLLGETSPFEGILVAKGIPEIIIASLDRAYAFSQNPSVGAGLVPALQGRPRGSPLP